jgi:hypothetical protein
MSHFFTLTTVNKLCGMENYKNGNKNKGQLLKKINSEEIF